MRDLTDKLSILSLAIRQLTASGECWIKARADKLLDPRHVLGRDLGQELDGDAAGDEVEVEHVLGLRRSGCGGAEGEPREEEGDGD